jgi:leucine dehydrogenase
MFDSNEYSGHERIVFVADQAANLRAIIAIHNSALGPALGGCRFFRYSSASDAETDVLRLSRGMTMKAAVAGVPFGGGKMVVLAPSGEFDRQALFRAVGRAIDELGGRYITGEDVGTGPADMAMMREETKHVLGAPAELGGSGDPSPSTALGCFEGIGAALKHQRGASDLAGVRVAVQGLGNVGWRLSELLHDAGARLVVADVVAERLTAAVRRFGAQVVETESVHASDVDVFAPCALGAGLNRNTIPEIKARIVAGAANNQLAAEREDALRLQERGILYAPDYVINAGGMIQLAVEHASGGDVEGRVRAIGKTLGQIFDSAKRHGITTSEAAARIAQERIVAGRRRRTAA